MKSVTIHVGLAAIVAALAGCSATIPENSDSQGDNGVADAPDPGAVGSAALALAPSPSDVYINGPITTRGTGCSPNDVSVQVTPDKTTFAIYLSKMVLQASGRPFQRTNCIAGLPIHVPNGWQFSLATVNTQGYAHLMPGAKATESSRYSFAGFPSFSRLGTTIKPADGPYVFSDTVPIASLVWSPCGETAIFNINTELNLETKATDTASYVDTEQVDGRFRKILHLQFRQCH